MQNGNFIFIFEDGSSRYMQVVEDEDLQSADDGLLEVIDISTPSDPLTYYDGQWNQLGTGSPFE